MLRSAYSSRRQTSYAVLLSRVLPAEEHSCGQGMSGDSNGEVVAVAGVSSHRNISATDQCTEDIMRYFNLDAEVIRLLKLCIALIFYTGALGFLLVYIHHVETNL